MARRVGFLVLVLLQPVAVAVGAVVRLYPAARRLLMEIMEPFRLTRHKQFFVALVVAAAEGLIVQNPDFQQELAAQAVLLQLARTGATSLEPLAVVAVQAILLVRQR
jgi:hypothetical protein